jgi:uncharacterized protein (TIGR02145 family)
MKKRIFIFILLVSVNCFGQGGYGSVVLPGNVTCANEYINVSPCGGLSTLSYNGYTYDLVEIGGQCWFKENLQTTTYRNGSLIDYPETDTTLWQNNTTGAYAWYDNDSTTYASTYGAIYNWYSVDNSAGLCPTGWHVPSDCEWMYLENTLGMSTVHQEDSTGNRGTDEGGKLKETGTSHWNSPNTGATNSSGFTSLPSGGRHHDGHYLGFRDYSLWWNSTEYATDKAWRRVLDSGSSLVGRWAAKKENGFSVRCIRDSSSIQTSLKRSTIFSTLNVHPNPFSDYLAIELESPSVLSLYNAQGKLLLNKKITITYSINTSHLSKGIYFLKVTSEKGVYSQKVIKQ